MPESVFACGNVEKCSYSIASTGMNAIQLKALRMWPKTCPNCGKQTRWQEKIPLLNTDTIKRQANGGPIHEKTTKEDRNQNRRQKRAADRGAGLH